MTDTGLFPLIGILPESSPASVRIAHILKGGPTVKPIEELEAHEVHMTRGSDRTAKRVCTEMWNWAYREWWAPNVTPQSLEFGTALHCGWQAIYEPKTWTDTTIEQKLQAGTEAFLASCQEQSDQYLLATSQTRLTWDGRDDYANRVELGQRMLSYYMYHIHPEADKGLKPRKTETKFRVLLWDENREPVRCYNSPECGQHHVPGALVVHEGRVDIIFEDLELGGYLIGDWKAQPLTAKVLTLDGWTTMGDLQVGDEVVGRNGKAQKIIGVYPQGTKQVYKVTTKDGSVTRATAEHLWLMYASSDQMVPKVLQTEQIITELQKGTGGRFFLPELSPIEYPEQWHTIDPYVLGLLIGDGGFSTDRITFTNSDGLTDEVFRLGPSHWSRGFTTGNGDYTVKGAVPDIRALGLMGHLSINKFIPEQYKRGSIEQRKALLAGLLDTDGHPEKGNAKFYTSSHQLARDVKELVESLGGRGFLWIRQTKREASTVAECVVTVYLPNGENPFRLKRKADKFTPGKWKNRKRVVSIIPDGEEETQCIRVSNEDSLYVTDDHILTHNSIGGDRATDGTAKNTSRFYPPDLIWNHDQLSFYDYALRYEMRLDVRGHILCEIRKDYPKAPAPLQKPAGRFSRAKTLATTYGIYYAHVTEHDPIGYAEGYYDEYLEWLNGPEAPIFHKRTKIRKSPDELKQVGLSVANEVKAMLTPGLQAYPEPGPIACPRCSFRGPCEMKMRGMDHTYTLKTQYHQGDGPEW